MNARIAMLLGSIISFLALILLLYQVRHPETPSEFGAPEAFILPEEVEHSPEALPSTPKDQDIAANDVFSPLRGAAAPSTASPEKKIADLKSSSLKYDLTGIFVYGEQRGALLVPASVGKPSDGGKRKILHEGDSVGGGFHLKEIGPEQVILSRGSETTTLPLRKRNTEKKQ